MTEGKNLDSSLPILTADNGLIDDPIDEPAKVPESMIMEMTDGKAGE